MIQIISFIGIGLAAGMLSGLFGIGGGIAIVPLLILVAGFAPAMATGTSLGVFLLPVGILGAWQYYQRGSIDIRASLLIGVGLFFGAYLGARLGLSLDPVTLKRSFAVFLVLVAVRLWVSPT